VTGGAGFIGTHLSEYLLAQGHQVLVLDNFFTGRRDNLQPLLGNQRLSVITHDIVDELPAEIINKGGKVECIYNLACPASPIHYQKDPVKTIKANVVGMTNVLELARKNGARILQASTSEVYGDPTEHPQNENYRGSVNCVGPRACYDEGKRCAETLCFDYQRQYGLDIKIVRIFNTYGPKMTKDDGRVVSNFITQALRGEEITIYGDGSQTRSFQYVSDLVEGLVKMMAVDNFSGPVNLGNPEEFTIKN